MKKALFLVLLLSCQLFSKTIELSEFLLSKNKASTVEAIINYIRESTTPVILKFYADWCAPCKRMIPITNQVADYFGDRLIIINISADLYDDVYNHFKVRYLPTLIYFSKGKEVQRTNSVSRENLISIIEKLGTN